MSKKVKTGVILVENAKLNSYQTDSWAELEKTILNSCEIMTRRIANLEKTQTKVMNDLQKYTEQQERNIQESYNNYYGINNIELRNLIELL